jgi:hypothetical protein
MSDLVTPIFDASKPTRMECGVFDRLQVVTQPLGGTMVSWSLKDGFKAKGPFNFFVDVARTGASPEEWQPVNKTPAVDDCMLTDPHPRHFDQLADQFYRVRLCLPGEGGAVHHSAPQQANGLWSRRDWLQAREIVRKEHLQQRKRTNTAAVGWILQRRRWGQPCGRCIDFDTGEVVSKGCHDCFGTEFTGGYFRAIHYVFTSELWSREFRWDDNVGIRNDVTKPSARGVNHPHLQTNDVYVRRDNGERYFINKIDVKAELGGIPLIINAELRLAPANNIVYTVPLIGIGSSQSSSSAACGPQPPVPPSSSSSSAACDYRSSLDAQDAW